MKLTTAGGTNAPEVSRRARVAEHAQLQRAVRFALRPTAAGWSGQFSGAIR